MMDIWEKVKQHQGEVFRTVSNLDFTYTVIGETVIHTRSKVPLSKSDFEKAARLAPKSVADLHNDVTGPSYVYAIITDVRLQ